MYNNTQCIFGFNSYCLGFSDMRKLYIQSTFIDYTIHKTRSSWDTIYIA